MFTAIRKLRLRTVRKRTMADQGLRLDASYGEGGGQVLRNTVALSALLGKAVHLSNIRSKRSNPGLARQHLTGLNLVTKICSGTVTGAKVKSTTVELKPGNLKGGKYVADVEGAGSICLLIQVSLPCILFCPEKVSLELHGGTNAIMAPQVDYLTSVFGPMVKRMGISFDLNLVTRGFYPKGGGHVILTCDPIQSISPLILEDRGEIVSIDIFTFCAGVIPDHVPQRMSNTAKQILEKKLPEFQKSPIAINIRIVKETKDKAFGDGTGILITALTSTNCILAGSRIGEKRKKSEDLGTEAAEELLAQIQCGGCVDEYLQDQIIIFMGLACGHSKVKVGPLTEHTRTSIHFTQLLTGATFTITEIPGGRAFWIECDGISYQNKYLTKS